MTRAFLPDEAQARFTQARLDTIESLGRLAKDHNAAFVVVAGDVFESNAIDPKTVARSLDAMKRASIPFLLLPGNHDPLDPASIYLHNAFRRQKPANVHVLDGTAPIEIQPGVKVYGAPWPNKRPLNDLAQSVYATLPTDGHETRILVAHGATDSLSPDPTNPSLVRLAPARQAVKEGRIHYVALGDRHSTTQVDAEGRIWYSGAPEPTDFDETDAGNCLLVDLTPEMVKVEKIPLGAWRFVRESFEFSQDSDLDHLHAFLDGQQRKETTICRLGLKGSLSLDGRARMDESIAQASQTFGHIEKWEKEQQLVTRPDTADLDRLGLTGYAHKTLESLVEQSTNGPHHEVAQEALILLHRLVQQGKLEDAK